MRVKKITDFDQFLSLREEWNKLHAKSNNPTLPLTHEWISCWWTQFSKEKRLNILCFYEKEQLLAIAPMMVQSSKYRGLPCNSLRLIANGHSPYSDILFDATSDEQLQIDVINTIIEDAQQDIVVFPKISNKSGLLSQLLTIGNYGRYKYGIKPSLLTPNVAINTDWETFFQSKSRKFRKGINKKVTKFLKNPEHSISCEKITSSRSKILQEMVEVSKKSWKKKIGNDLGSNIDSKNFLFSLADTYGPAGKMTLWLAMKSKKAIACELHILQNNTIYPIRADFDESYRDISPGSVVEFFALKSLFDNNTAKQYYSCADNYKYLSHWTHTVIEHATVEVFPRKLKANILFTLEYRIISTLRSIRDRLKSREIDND